MRVAPHRGTPRPPRLSLYMRAASQGNWPRPASSPSVIRNVSAVLVPHEAEFSEEKFVLLDTEDVDVDMLVVVVVMVVEVVR